MFILGAERDIMERFCEKCGTLVSGEGTFCPNCGAALPSAVSLGKSTPTLEPMSSNPMPNYYGGQSNSEQQSYNQSTPSNQAQMPVYPQSYNNNGMQNQYQQMSVGSWVGTIILSSLGIIGLIFLFIWAFDSSTMQPKKNFARGYLLVMAIMVGVSILFAIIMTACTSAALNGIMSGFGEFYDYY